MVLNNPLEKLTDDELDKKITSLRRIVYTGNFNLSQQARDILATHEEEQQRRLDKKLLEYYKKNNLVSKEADNGALPPLNIG